jgi:hypothetical protein
LPAFRSADPDTCILYTQIWLALRHRLPEELVVLVARFSDLKVPDPARTVVCEETITVQCPDAERRTAIWFRSGVLEQRDVARTAAVQLVTVSSDQGSRQHRHTGSEGWFELGVFAGDAPEPETEAGSGWWRSHENQPTYASPEFVMGAIMCLDKDGAPALGAGHRIVVRACAQHANWKNHGEKGELRFWRWFEPEPDVVLSRLTTCRKEGACGYCVAVDKT